MELRSYQTEAVRQLYDYFLDKTGNPLVVMPTGTGKSLVIAGFAREALAAHPETRILVLTHVKELIAQNYQALMDLWPQAPAGIYSAGLSRRDIDAQILFAGIQSIRKHAHQVQRCDIVIIDEAHRIGRADIGMYYSFIQELDEINNGYLKVLGFTATPYRMDSGLLHEGDDRLFTDIAYTVPMLRMIKDGYLCPVVPKQPTTQLDVSGVGTRGGEFIAKDLEAAVDKEETTASAVEEIVTLGADRGSWLVFCSGVSHAENVRNAIRKHGISAETVTGGTPAAERNRILIDYKAGRLRCVTNANVLTTGFDAPGTDLIALLRPTKSVSLYVQMVGRGMRIAPGKEDCSVLDFAGNTFRHGPVDTVDGRKKENDVPGDAPVKHCPQCGSENHTAARFCVQCGYEFVFRNNVDVEAAIDALLSTQNKAQWVPIQDVTYATHSKPGKPISLRVTYHSGMLNYPEWVCLEHTGYARQQAVKWWMRRSETPIPSTVAEAMTGNIKLKKPTFIQVKPVGKYTDIIAVRFEE